MRMHFAVALCCLVFAVSAAHAQLTIAGADEPFEPDDQGKAVINVTLRNGGGKPVPLDLSIGPFESEHKMRIRVKAAFADPRLFAKPLAPNARLAVRIDAQAKWPAGISEGKLRNGSAVIGTIKVDKDPAFNVTPAGWTAEAPLAVRMEDGSPTTLRFTNPDGIPWRLKWELIAGNESLGDTITIGPNGETAVLRLDDQIKDRWFPTSAVYMSLFRDENIPARLRLVPLRGNGQADPLWPSRDLDVKLHRSYWSSAGRTWVGSIVLILVLTIGGVCSLLVGNFLPNWRRKSKVINRILDTARRVRALPDDINSQVRVRTRVDAQRLLDELRPRWTMSSDFLEFVKVQESEVDRLEQRVALLEEIGDRIDSITAENECFAPTYLTQAYDCLAAAQRLFATSRTNDAALAGARTAVDTARKILSDIREPSDAMRANAAARVATGIKSIKDPSVAAVLKIVRNVSGWLTEDYATAAAINADNFCAIDAAVTKLALIEDFVSAVADADKTRNFAALLNSDGYAAMRSARLMALQLKQGITTEKITEAIKNNAFVLDIDPMTLDVAQPAMFRVVFGDEVLNTPAARFGITSEWNFGDSLREKGWNVAHYYRERGDYEVKVQFFRDGKAIAQSAPATVNVSRERERQWIGNQTWHDLLRLAIVVGLAILGLLAGAKDQIEKVDLIPGLIAVFTLGFSADQIKNVLAPKE